MQANTRPCLKVLTVLKREALVEISALGIRGRRRKITSDLGLLLVLENDSWLPAQPSHPIWLVFACSLLPDPL